MLVFKPEYVLGLVGVVGVTGVRIIAVIGIDDFTTGGKTGADCGIGRPYGVLLMTAPFCSFHCTVSIEMPNNNLSAAIPPFRQARIALYT